MKEQFIFDEMIFKNCLIETFWDRLWICWQVLIGNVSVVMFNIPAKKFYKSTLEKEGV